MGSENKICFNVAEEEILRIEESGEVFLRGKSIGGDGSLYSDFLKWNRFVSTTHGGTANIPEDAVSPGSLTFWVEGEESPIISVDLSGVRVRGELTEDQSKILSALRTFLDKGLENV